MLLVVLKIQRKGRAFRLSPAVGGKYCTLCNDPNNRLIGEVWEKRNWPLDATRCHNFTQYTFEIRRLYIPVIVYTKCYWYSVQCVLYHPAPMEGQRRDRKVATGLFFTYPPQSISPHKTINNLKRKRNNYVTFKTFCYPCFKKGTMCIG